MQGYFVLDIIAYFCYNDGNMVVINSRGGNCMKSICSVLMNCAALVISAVLVLGCSVAVKPGNVPMVKGIDNVSLKGVSLIVMNAEKDSSEFEIPNEKGQKLGIIANRQVWSGKLVEALSGELAKRGAQLRSRAPLQLSVAIPDIIFGMANNSYQFTVKVSVTSSKGWSKTYDGVAESGTGLLESTTSLTERLAGQALTAAVKAMLGDAEFLKQVGQKG
jgi:hypothetical protein